MALQLSLENDQGHSGDYWKISKLDIDYNQKHVYLEIHLFKDSAASAANKQSMTHRQYTWTEDDEGTDNWAGWFNATALDTIDQNPQERAYEKLKTLAEFSGATDV